MTIDFTAVLTKIDGTLMQKPKEKTAQQIAEEKELAASGRPKDELKFYMEVIHAKYIEFEPITLAFVAGEALLNTLEGETDVTGAERYDRRKLAKRIYANAQDISTVEREKIKELVAKAFKHNGALVGAAYELLDK